MNSIGHDQLVHANQKIWKTKPHKEYFDWSGRKLGHSSMEDWYNVTAEDIHKYKGNDVLKLYHNSLVRALKSVYRDHDWVQWKFKWKQKGFWESSVTKREFFDWLGLQLGYRHMEDWYNVTGDEIQKNGGNSLLSTYYDGSPSRALQDVYPEHNWIIWRFNTVPTGYWDKGGTQKNFFEWLSVQLEHGSMEDWYTVTLDQIAQYGGQGLAKSYYNCSPSKALQSIHPEHNWMLWRFKQAPLGYWETVSADPLEQKRIIEWLSKQLNIKSLDNWYRASMRQIHKWISIETSQILAQMLSTVYPQHQWDMSKFNRPGKSIKSSQRELVVSVQKLFPGYSNSNNRINTFSDPRRL